MTMANVRVRMTEVDYDPFATTQIARSFPTTAAQREVWLAAELGREASLAYNESITLEMRGALDVDVLKAALRELTDRHEALRATFDSEGANMLVSGQIDLPLEVIDLASVDHAARDEEFSRLRALAVETPFDLLNGPLIRTVLVRTAPDLHELILTTHHIVCDGWSFGVVSRDLMTLYKLIRDGRVAGELPPAASFGDYALSDHEPEQLRAVDADEQYWVGMFDRGQPVLDLPTDRPRGHQRTFASRRLDYVLPPELVASARRLGAKQGVSLFATLFGIFAAMIDRLGAEGGVVVGVPSAGQAARGMESLVGHCINLLPVLVTTDRAESVTKLLKQSGTRVLDAYDHQNCTFGQLLTKLNVQREANRLPLVSVLFNIDSPIPSETLSMDGLAVSLRSNPRAFENFELFVNASQTDEGVVLECQYHSELFDADTVQRWLALYQSAIERAVADPDRPVAELFSATDDDRRRLREFNETTQSYPRDDRIEVLFARQAASTPDAIALVFGEESYTYRELDARSNAVARVLHDRGIGAGQLVGMGCGRNPYMLVAMLGILKSGAAYVPLDPAYPPERLSYMCTDAGLRCIISDSSVSAVGPAGLDVLLAEEFARDAAPVSSSADPMAPAYVIYTSGSTGKPKGVVVQHRAVVNFLTSMAREPGLTSKERLVAVTSTSFDIAVLELFLPLTVGASIIVADREAVLDGAALRTLIERHDVTTLQATPAGWRLLIDSGWMGGAGFKALVGGEALPGDLAHELVSRAGQVWNMYGPTETTVWSTCWLVPGQFKGISIGHPIANTEVLVLDEALRPCPIGVPGEVFIGGDGVAAGYWNQPELTDTRFVIRDGARIYRTGDRGRWRSDGTLEHLGRLDFQVKVRGYRIELGEIESALAAHPDVDQAVVIAREDKPGDVRLAAYMIPSAGKTTEAKVLRAFLRKSLPDYMVPSHIVMLAAIPLLPNGKVNRRALPRPDNVDQMRPAMDAPSTPTEAAVLKVMEEVLTLHGLRLDDDFFSSGGHSLLAARLVAKLNAKFATSLPLSKVFESSTARSLALAVEDSKGAGRGDVPHVVRQNDQSIGPLTVMQERMRFIEEFHPGRVVFNTPSAHRLKGPFDLGAFTSAFRELIGRQPALRTYIERGSNGTHQRVADLLKFDLPVEDLSALDEASRESELMRHMQAIIDVPINIYVPPLFRVALFRLAPEEHVFLFMPHHIIWDGWSFDLLYEELASLYPAALAGESPGIAVPQVSYVDYAVWQNEWLKSKECADQSAFWAERYGKPRLHVPLPTDWPRRRGAVNNGGVEWISIDRETTEGLRSLAAHCGVTVNMIVLAIYGAMLAEATSSETATIGVPMRARPLAEVERVMGFFTNLVPVEIRLDGNMPVADWLIAAKRNLSDAIAYQDVPFVHWASIPEVARQTAATGIYQSAFSFQDARERQRHWGPLAHSSILVMQKGADEELGLWLMDVPHGLEGGFNYNTDLFKAETIQMLRDRLTGLLQRIVSEPNCSLAKLLNAPGSDRDAFAVWLGEHGAKPVAFVPTGEQQHADRRSSELERLAEIWAALLGIDSADIHADDNFFDLGGNSMLVMRAVAESREKLGVEVDPRRYVYETLRQLSAPTETDDGQGSVSSDTTEAIARIWARLLGLDVGDIHTDDNFFDLGGTSILAMEAITAMDKELGWQVDPRRMVYETVLQLAVMPAREAQAAATSSVTETTSSEQTPSSGLVSRMFGRLGRRG